MTDFLKQFKNPGPEYRGKPFWAWNGKLEKDELLRQIKVMKDMGLGGYFMHSRTGLVTEYLGKEWFDLINACSEEGEALGLESWLYDEDRWPSGLAGGLVTKEPQYRAKRLAMKTYAPDDKAWRSKEPTASPELKPGDCVGIWACTMLNGTDFTSSRIIPTDKPETKLTGKTIIVIEVQEQASSPFYNGYTYVDVLNREATDEYIRITHAAYKEHCGHHFGKAIKGIFTDEPNRGPMLSNIGEGNSSGVVIPWTESLFDKFEKRFGYNVIDRLPEVFLRKDGQTDCQVTWHYVEIVEELFIDNFAKPCFDWCDKNDLVLTGHILHENTLSCQTAVSGSMQRYYPYMHAPGIDVLGEATDCHWIAKQLSSSARQDGQKWLLSELYGCTGWQFSFASHKQVGDWQALFGINLRSHHLSWYTMAGEAKRDYPASILHQSAWYDEYSHVESYFARIGLFMMQGDPCCEILIINSVESLWPKLYPGAIHGLSANDARIRELEKQYEETFRLLCGNHLDFDYGDEGIMAVNARVAREDDRALLYVGKAAYSKVIVSGLDTIRSTTLNLLREFRNAGGEIIFVDQPPYLVDALPSDDARALAKESHCCELRPESFIPALTASLKDRVEILDHKGNPVTNVYCQMRKNEPGYQLMALNIDRKHGIDQVLIRVRCSGQAEELLAQTGDLCKAEYNQSGDWLEIRTSFPAGGEHLFRIVPDGACQTAPSSDLAYRDNIKLEGPFNYELAEENVAVLDMADYLIDDSVKGRDEILHIDGKVRDHFDLPGRAGNMIQPWFRGESANDQVGKLALAYKFYIDNLPEAVDLAIEKPELFEVRLNGTLINIPAKPEFWIDIAFKRINLPGELLKKGENRLELSTVFTENHDLEAMYLLGSFGVEIKNGHCHLGKLPEKVSPADLATQGLPFYSGKIRYILENLPEALEGKPARINVSDFEGAYVKVLSGTESQLVAWDPYVADLAKAKAKGMILEVCLTRRNTFGPLHLNQLINPSYGPGHYNPHGDMFTEEYMLYPAGLLSAPELQTNL